MGSQHANLGDFLDIVEEESGVSWDSAVNGAASGFLTSEDTVVSWQCDVSGGFFLAPIRTVCHVGCLVCLGAALNGRRRIVTLADDPHSMQYLAQDRMFPLRPEHIRVTKNVVAEFVCGECGTGWNTCAQWIRSRRSGCPRCRWRRYQSEAEMAIARSLRHLYGSAVSVEMNVPVGGRYGPLDMVLTTASGAALAVEYDGWYWHLDAEQIRRDTEKTAAVRAAGYVEMVRLRQLPEGKSAVRLPDVPGARNIPAGTRTWDPRVLCEIATIVAEHDPTARTVTLTQARDAKRATAVPSA
ncbi:hypothetical protein MUG78_16880 [Gordonia alkaliphila]|uniref:hypothetical protein n=1 Tax=Gordonia alkaliphila TaxID=1053547 RepID=UPI001FF3B9D7|nr:hypothetical protein [Gordonia alkaliphila]MCK0441076.1 hypothetical protein [Gordonia alkaliphila]